MKNIKYKEEEYKTYCFNCEKKRTTLKIFKSFIKSYFIRFFEIHRKTHIPIKILRLIFSLRYRWQSKNAKHPFQTLVFRVNAYGAHEII